LPQLISPRPSGRCHDSRRRLLPPQLNRVNPGAARTTPLTSPPPPCFGIRATVPDSCASRRGRRPPVPVIRSPPHPARAGAESARRAAQTEPHGSRGRGTGKAAQNHGSSAACLLARRGGSSDDVAGARPCVSEGFTAPGELNFFFISRRRWERRSADRDFGGSSSGRGLGVPSRDGQRLEPLGSSLQPK